MHAAGNLILVRETFSALGDHVTRMAIAPTTTKHARQPRAAERTAATLPVRLTWKDARGTVRFATAVTRNISAYGMYVECHSPIALPLYRLVYVQIDREGLNSPAVPPAFLRGRVLSAVYRVNPASVSNRHGLALRLMLDPRCAAAAEQTRATA